MSTPSESQTPGSIHEANAIRISAASLSRPLPPSVKDSNAGGAESKETSPSCARLKGEGEAPSGAFVIYWTATNPSRWHQPVYNSGQICGYVRVYHRCQEWDLSEALEKADPMPGEIVLNTVWAESVQGSEVHASQGPPATPIHKSPPSGPTDNDSKEEEWKAGENALITAGRDFFDIEREDAEEIGRLHNAALSALRARLQKQEEDTKRLDWLSEHRHYTTMEIIGKAGLTVREAIDAAISQTPSLVQDQQISPKNPKHNK